MNVAPLRRIPARTATPIWSPARACLALLVLGLAACGDSGTAPESEPEPLTVRVESGDGQVGLPELPLRDDIVVRVVGPDGQPRGRSRLEAQVRSGEGRLSSRQFTTNGQGLAVLDWTLGASPGEQMVDITSLDSSVPASVTVRARALGPDETDVIVVRDAAAPLLGAALFQPGGGDGGRNRVLQSRVVADTVIHLYPEDGGESEVVVFGKGNPPGRMRAGWTSGIDTVVVRMRPPIAVDLVIDNYTDSDGRAVGLLMQQVEIMNVIWAEEGMGLVVGDVTVNERSRDGVFVGVMSSGLCPGAVRRLDEVRISLVDAIDGGAFNGWGCTSGNVWMSNGFERFPNLLVHELGHVWSLVHTTRGVMVPRPPGTTFTEGEVYRAHFNAFSGLNTSLGGWPEEEWVTCLSSRPDSPCLPPDFDLGDDPAAF